MRKIKLSKLKNILKLQKNIINHFKIVTGLSDDITIRLVNVREKFQSDCDGDDNKVSVEITHKIGGFGKLKEPIIDIVKMNSVLCDNFEMLPKINQKIYGYKNHPCVETIFEFDYYNFTKR